MSSHKSITVDALYLVTDSTCQQSANMAEQLLQEAAALTIQCKRNAKVAVMLKVSQEI